MQAEAVAESREFAVLVEQAQSVAESVVLVAVLALFRNHVLQMWRRFQQCSCGPFVPTWGNMTEDGPRMCDQSRMTWLSRLECTNNFDFVTKRGLPFIFFVATQTRSL